jgi:uncharacterized protein
VASPEQRKFGMDKRDSLTSQCKNCKVRNWCNGGCPKDRFALSKDGEPGHNYLCAGLEKFFMHTGPTFNVMVQLLKQGHAPADIMETVAVMDEKRGPYALCACGSGKKFRFCHGDNSPSMLFSGVGPVTAAAKPSQLASVQADSISREIPSLTISDNS